ncbi:MAG: hypothetical protein SPE13_04450 [Alloprevotella sp.]|nr:hypothetical protein [Alloprevotella sp.]
MMNSQIRCGSCREKVYGVFYKLRDKKRSKESAYVLVGFLVRPFVSFVSRIARYAPSSTDKSSSLRNQKSTQLIFRTPLFLFIALRWMQPDRGMVWQAENPELAREFPAGTASKARQSRLHQAQGVFPVFVFHSFVQFLNISRVPCSETN